jgi:L-ascorbate metabolism protein UlaG (beta-lactamase superfamily)
VSIVRVNAAGLVLRNAGRGRGTDLSTATNPTINRSRGYDFTNTLKFLVAGLLAATASTSMAANVKVTLLGRHDGEFCKFDRAMIFEDPDGTRILYDAGRTVAGINNPRLGKIDALLVLHMHVEHVGDHHVSAVNAQECGNPDVSVKDAPNTGTVNLAIAKKAKIITGSEMPRFFAGKLKALGGDPKAAQPVRFGASRKVGGAAMATVPAVHSNGVVGALIGGELGKMLDAAGLTAYAGPPTGSVLTFSNALAVYLSGDTGITAEQEPVVRRHYGVKLVVINIGDTFTTGPTEAAFVIDELVKPMSVIPSHANEAATKNGKPVAGTRTAKFFNAVKTTAHLPLSGRTVAFDANGMCPSGCSISM